MGYKTIYSQTNRMHRESDYGTLGGRRRPVSLPSAPVNGGVAPAPQREVNTPRRAGVGRTIEGGFVRSDPTLPREAPKRLAFDAIASIPVPVRHDPHVPKRGLVDSKKGRLNFASEGRTVKGGGKSLKDMSLAEVRSRFRSTLPENDPVAQKKEDRPFAQRTVLFGPPSDNPSFTPRKSIFSGNSAPFSKDKKTKPVDSSREPPKDRGGIFGAGGKSTFNKSREQRVEVKNSDQSMLEQVSLPPDEVKPTPVKGAPGKADFGTSKISGDATSSRVANKSVGSFSRSVPSNREVVSTPNLVSKSSKPKLGFSSGDSISMLNTGIAPELAEKRRQQDEEVMNRFVDVFHGEAVALREHSAGEFAKINSKIDKQSAITEKSVADFKDENQKKWAQQDKINKKQTKINTKQTMMNAQQTMRSAQQTMRNAQQDETNTQNERRLQENETVVKQTQDVLRSLSDRQDSQGNVLANVVENAVANTTAIQQQKKEYDNAIKVEREQRNELAEKVVITEKSVADFKDENQKKWAQQDEINTQQDETNTQNAKKQQENETVVKQTQDVLRSLSDRTDLVNKDLADVKKTAKKTQNSNNRKIQALSDRQDNQGNELVKVGENTVANATAIQQQREELEALEFGAKKQDEINIQNEESNKAFNKSLSEIGAKVDAVDSENKKRFEEYVAEADARFEDMGGRLDEGAKRNKDLIDTAFNQTRDAIIKLRRNVADELSNFVTEQDLQQFESSLGGILNNHAQRLREHDGAIHDHGRAIADVRGRVDVILNALRDHYRRHGSQEQIVNLDRALKPVQDKFLANLRSGHVAPTIMAGNDLRGSLTGAGGGSTFARTDPSLEPKKLDLTTPVYGFSSRPSERKPSAGKLSVSQLSPKPHESRYGYSPLKKKPSEEKSFSQGHTEMILMEMKRKEREEKERKEREEKERKEKRSRKK